MAEQLMKPLILIVTMVGIFIIIATAMTPVFSANQSEMGKSANVPTSVWIGGDQYNKWYPLTGYEIGEDNVTINSGVNFNSNELIFWQDVDGSNESADAIRAWIISLEGNGWQISYFLQDLVGMWGSESAFSEVFYDITWSGWEDDYNVWGIIVHRHTGWVDDWYDFISFNTILNNKGIEPTTGNTTAKGDIRLDTGYSLWAMSDGTVEIGEAIVANSNYSLFLGWTMYNETLLKQNAWNIIAGILSFNLPGVHPLITAIIAIPIYTCIGFIVVTLIMRAIPLIGD